MKQYPLIELPGLDPIEAEKGEVLVNPSGIAFSIGGKPHSRGGTKMVAEPGSYILSKHLKLDEEVVETLGYGDKAMSPAAMAKRTPTEKYLEVLESADTSKHDKLAKKTAALMLQKNANRLDMIYEAQEQMKKSKRMRNDLDHAKQRLGKFQTGGEIPPPDLTPEEMFALDNPGTPWPARKQKPLSFTVTGNTAPYDPRKSRAPGWSEISPEGLYQSFWRPFSNDPYFDIADDLKQGRLTADNKRILGERQKTLSNLKQSFPGQEGSLIEKEYAKYLKAADEIEQDQFLDKFVVGADGKEIPLAQATEQQIDNAAGFRFFNKRTGKNDLIDYRDRQNQGFDPVLTYTMAPDKLDTRNPPISRRPVTGETKLPPPPSASVPPAAVPGQTRKGIDWQSIVNGTEIGLLAADLATTRTKPPYHDYAPSELAYTRFEPINTKQQERAFNLAADRISNSNMSGQQKAAYIASMYGQMAEGANQVDIANYQAKLANDNRNINLYDARRNQDIQREQDANLKYIQAADTRNYQAAAQRQAYLDNIMSVWRNHVSNRRDVGLVNQFSRNYDYNFGSQQVEYVPGQGAPAGSDNLRQFKKNDIDPRFLTAEGLRAYGFTNQ